ncbi:MAG: hypothetical protein JWQ72_2030 [Polaromonas sp.]|nr:hypothetical protein [Polaromonas sp.]
MSLSELERMAFAIRFGEIEGNTFDFDRMAWEPQK